MKAQPFPLAGIHHAIAEQFPLFDHVPIRAVLGDGFSSLAIEMANGAVFLIAKQPGTEARHRRAVAILQHVAAHLPVAVPAIRWQVSSTSALPFGAIGYVKLGGQVVTPSAAILRTADSLGHFLAKLHAIPTAPIEPNVELVTRGPLQQLGAEALWHLQKALDASRYAIVDRWFADLLGDPTMWSAAPVLIHGDLWYENLLIDESTGELTGVLDWEDARVGDSAQDLATLMYLGAPFVQAVIAAYRHSGGRMDEHLGRRVAGYWELREFVSIPMIARLQDPTEWQDQLTKLVSGPIFRVDRRFVFTD